MVNAQQWLDKNCPLESRNEIIELDIRSKNLEGELKLDGFYNLREIDCSHNKITLLDITDINNSLEVLRTDNNQISQLNWKFNAPTNLKVLNLANNNWHDNNGFWNFSLSFPRLRFLDIRNSGIKKKNMGNIDHIEEIYQDTIANNKWSTRIWTDIHQDLTTKKQKEWESKGFSHAGCKEWIDIGLKTDDADFAWWLKNIKKKNSEWILNCGDKEELRKEYKDYSILRWHNKGFADEEISAWASVGLGLQDGGYAAWMRDVLKITPYEYSDCLGENNDDSLLREQHQKFLEERKVKSKEENSKNWRTIHPNLTPELQVEWEQHGFTYEEVKEWVGNGFGPDYNELYGHLKKQGITPRQARFMAEWGKKGFAAEQSIEWVNAGLEPSESGYAQWLRDVKKVDVNWYLSHENRESLWEEYITNNKFSVESVIRSMKREKCEECHQNTALKVDNDYIWCQPCNAKHFQEEFKNWTSGNPEIDKFIQKSQLEATHMGKLVQWMPYESFTNIEFLAEGGFGKVYKAKLLDKPIVGWDATNKKWKRDEVYNGEIALKSLKTADFLREINSHKLVDEDYVIGFFGISQDPKTKDYLMIMEYMPEGNLKHFLQNNYSKSSLEMKLQQAHVLSHGLNHIHKKGLIHKDFHPGNILVSINKYNINQNFSHFFITDLGLSRHTDEKDDGKIYGVLPYTAPEVLSEGKYTQASDVYSFGMVIYELMTGSQPYYDILHNDNLGIKICSGFRPNLDKVLLPQLLKDLISKCWDADPEKRPKIDELENILLVRFTELSSKKTDSEFYWQCQPIKETEIENHCKPLSELYQQITGQTKEINSYEQWQKTAQELYPEFCKQKKYDWNTKEAKEEFNKLLHPIAKQENHLTHFSAVHISRLLDFKNLPQPQNDPSQERQAYVLLGLQIEKIEEEINLLKESLENELAELVDKFVEVKKKSLKDKTKQIKRQAGGLKKQLEEKGLAEEKIDGVIRCCEKLVELEQQLEKEQLRTQVEIPTNK